MSTATRVFVARVAGLPVFDPNGDQVGRVRDVVVALRIGRDAPRVLGLAVEIQAHRRIFVPIGRVNTVDPEAVVLTSGTVSLRRFDKRPGETLVLAELLDRRVTLLATESTRGGCETWFWTPCEWQRPQARASRPDCVGRAGWLPHPQVDSRVQDRQ